MDPLVIMGALQANALQEIASPMGDFRSSSFSVVVFIVVVGFLCWQIPIVLRFSMRRRRKRGNLSKVSVSSEPSGYLSNYQHIRVSDQFRRDKAWRIAEGYHDKQWEPGYELFELAGEYDNTRLVDQHGRSVDGCESIGNVQVLVPVAARAHLKKGENSAEIVVAGDVGYVIRLNGTFDLLEEIEANTRHHQTTLSDESSVSDAVPEAPSGVVDTSSQSEDVDVPRLTPSSIDSAIPPVNHQRYLMDIRDDQLLIYKDQVWSHQVTFPLLVFLWLVFGLVMAPAALLLLVGVLAGGPAGAIELLVEMFHYVAPALAMGVGLYALLYFSWLASRSWPSNETLLIFDRKNRQVVFLSHGNGQVRRLAWSELFALAEQSTWLDDQFGYFATREQDAFLELATENRHHRGRCVVRLNHSDLSQSMQTWRAIQAFMEEGLQRVDQLPVESASGEPEPPFDGIYTARQEWSELQSRPDGWYKTLRKLLFIVLGGPLPYRLAGWLARCRNESTWRAYDRLVAQTEEGGSHQSCGTQSEWDR